MKIHAKTISLITLFTLFTRQTIAHESQIVLVGILSEPTSEYIRSKSEDPQELWSYVTGSYADWISQSAAVPVLIPFDTEKEHLDFFLDNLDVVVLQGGGAPLDIEVDHKRRSTHFQNVTDYVIKRVKKINQEGRYFPLIGTCLGFENLIISENGNNPEIMDCDFNDKHKNHTVRGDYDAIGKTKIWSQFNQTLVKRVFGDTRLYYTHDCGFRIEKFNKVPNLKENYHVLGFSKTDDGKEFIAGIEHKTFPIIANQWHPEKNQFERGELYSFLDRSEETTRFTSDIIRRVVELVRPKARRLDQTNPLIRPYFASNRAAEAIHLKSYERIYCFEKSEREEQRAL